MRKKNTEQRAESTENLMKLRNLGKLAINTNLPKLLNFTTVGKFADTAKKLIANG